MKNICFVGGGNGTHVGSVLLAYKNYNINILTRKPEKWTKNMKLLLDNGTEIEGVINKISSKPEDVIPESDILFISSPVHVYENIIKNVSPYLSNGTSIGTLFTQGHLDLMMEKHISDYKHRNITFFGLQYIPWQAKTIEYGKMGHLVGRKKELFLSVKPIENQNTIKDQISELFDMNVHLQPFLANCLTTSNQILHPVRYYCVFNKFNSESLIKKSDIPILYLDMDDESAELLDLLVEDIMIIKTDLINKFNLDLTHVLTLKKRINNQYGSLVKDYTNTKTIFNTATMYRKSKFAMINIDNNHSKININHRHFLDDIPFGLVILKSISIELNIDTPVLDKLIYWTQKLMKKEYLVNNQLIGKDIGETGIFQNYNKSFIDIV
jgi:opine dehydrogenase